MNAPDRPMPTYRNNNFMWVYRQDLHLRLHTKFYTVRVSVCCESHIVLKIIITVTWTK